MKKFGTYDVVVVGLLAALAGALQLAHGWLGVPTGFGMTVDLVALPVLLAFFLFGFEHAVWVLLLACAIITVAAPDSWIGASMKFAGTLPMIAVPAAYLVAEKRAGWLAPVAFAGVLLSVGVLVFSGQAGLALKEAAGAGLPGGNLAIGFAAVAALALVAGVLVWLWRREGEGLSSDRLSVAWVAVAVFALAVVVRGAATVVSNYYYAVPVFFGIPAETFMAMVPWWVIFGWNALQGVVEFWVAWVAAYSFGLVKRYGKW